MDFNYRGGVLDGATCLPEEFIEYVIRERHMCLLLFTVYTFQELRNFGDISFKNKYSLNMDWEEEDQINDASESENESTENDEQSDNNSDDDNDENDNSDDNGGERVSFKFS